MNNRLEETPQIDNTDIILEVHKISKRFGGIKALNNIDFSVRRGEVHALVGENGAGKSTFSQSAIFLSVKHDFTFARCPRT